MRRACPALHPAQTLLLATHTSQAAVACGVLTAPDVQQQGFAPGLHTDVTAAGAATDGATRHAR
eukprot:3702-Chlamydomonas_euryale.AAC.1